MRFRNFIRLSVICMLLASLVPAGRAQNSNFINYGIEEGLIMSQIEALVQDDRGDLWIGTIGGLSRYNGVGFKSYTQKDSLAEDWITSAYKDKDGVLWFGHWGGGLTRIDPGTNQVQDMRIEELSDYRLISAISGTPDGKIWVTTETGGLFSVNAAGGSGMKYELPDGVTRASALWIDDKGIIWVGTNMGICFVDGSGKVKGQLTQNEGLLSNSISAIIPGIEGEIWLGTNGAGVIRLSGIAGYGYNGLGNLSQYSLSVADGLSSNNIKTMYKDQAGIIWIGPRDNGVVQFIPDKANEKGGQLNAFSNKFEMKYYHANTFLQDREGNLWVGTEIGLNKYMGELFRLYNHNDGLPNNLVWSIMEDSKGSVWFGTSEGLSKFTFPVVGGLKQFNTPQVSNFTVAGGLSENIVISLMEDSRGNIWAGSENNGVVVLSGEGKPVKKFDQKSGLSDGKIFSICEDVDGQVWLGTREGVSKINPETWQITNYGPGDGLGGKKVYKIFKDSRNVMWMAILGGDLTSYSNGKFTTYGPAQGLTQKFITSIAEDMNKVLWFGAYGDGIVKYDGKTFSGLSIKDGMSSNTPHFITCDKDNNLWIGMNLGIEKYDQIEGKFVLYARKEGFLGMETNENAVARAADGQIWFGTIKGAVKFDPSKDRKNSVEALTYITGLKMFLQDYNLVDGAVYDYFENYFTFNVLGVSLSNPKEVQYMYYLEGFDDDWTPATKTGYITYSNLSPGTYVFKVKASNNHDVWNKNPVTYTFTIKPPFWETWWFYTLCGVFVIVLIVVVMKTREHKLRKRQEYLESEVTKRTEELRKEKEIVEKQNDNIKESLGYAKRIQEAILVPVDSVKKSFKDSFILYRPKDIVSGDFYWMHNTGTEVLIAAVDCTGHGVPGAFMSIIGNNLLNKVVKEQRVMEPAQILERLSEEVALALRQGTSEDSVKDGMDIVICSINQTTKKLSFAGAYNPMYVVRNQEVIEVKGDKIPIGESRKRITDPFRLHTIELLDGDQIYIFSDGFADQKGGPQSKKFFYPPFRKLLSEISTLPMTEQKKKLEATITEWRGGHEQYDDMLIFGVKI